jgi:hypothetical protein
LRARDEFDVTPSGKCLCIRGESACGNDEPTGRSAGRDHAVELSYDRNADFCGSPLLALHEIQLAALSEFEVDTTIGSLGSFPDVEPLPPKGLAHKHLEVAP